MVWWNWPGPVSPPVSCERNWGNDDRATRREMLVIDSGWPNLAPDILVGHAAIAMEYPRMGMLTVDACERDTLELSKPQ